MKFIHPITPARRVLTVALMLLLPVGCGAPQKPDLDTSEDYRTINTGPLRDAKAAARANEQGLKHLDNGELFQAERAFRNAIEQDLEYGPAHNNLGKILFLKRDFYQAAHEFDTAIKLMPKHAAPHNNLGLTLLEAGRLDDAVQSFRKATTLSPNIIEYQANLARTLVQRGDRTEEVVLLLRAVALRDERIDWRVWANHQLGALGDDP